MVLDPGRLASGRIAGGLSATRDLARLRDPLGSNWAVRRPLRVDATGLTGPRREEVDRGGWRLTSRHLYVPADAVVDQPVQRIVEAASRLPEGAAVTGWAALHLAGARWFEGVEADGRLLPVPLALGPHNRRPKDPATVLWREQLLPWQIEHRRGIPVGRRRRCSTRCAASARSDTRFRCWRWPCSPSSPACRFADYLATRNRRKWVGIARSARWRRRAPSRRRRPACDSCGCWMRNCLDLANVNVYGADGRFLGRADLLAPEAAWSLSTTGRTTADLMSRAVM